MKAIIGLGNPGKQYEKTRHNLGFVAVDNFQKKYGDSFSTFNLQKKLKAEISLGQINNKKLILAKPQTFMNLSGQAVSAIKSFYKIDNQDIWVIHDDLDLPPGSIRISTDSTAGGHNGIDSIINSLGDKNFVRFRIGIGRPDQGDPADYVLNIPNKKEQELMTETQEKIIKAIETALADSITKTQTEFN